MPSFNKISSGVFELRIESEQEELDRALQSHQLSDDEKLDLLEEAFENEWDPDELDRLEAEILKICSIPDEDDDFPGFSDEDEGSDIEVEYVIL
jgi:hypothetical protein